MPANTPGKEAAIAQVIRRITHSKAVITAAAFLLVYTAAGFLLAPYLVSRYVPRLAAEKLDRVARIGKVRINPYLLTFEANDASLSEQDGTPIAGFRQLFADFELSSLFRWAWTFRDLRLENPQANVVIARDGEVNFARLAPQGPNASQPESAEPSPLPRLVLQKIQIIAGEVALTDQRQSSPAHFTITPLDIDLTDITTLPERRGPYSLAATTGDGGTVAWTGELSLNPLRTSGNLRFEEIRVERLWEFARDSLDIAPPSGKLSVETDYALDLSGATPQLTFENLGIRLADLAVTLTADQQPLLQLASADVRDARFDLADRRLEIGKLALNRGAIAAAVDADGTLNLQRIARSGPAGSPSQATAPAEDSRPWTLKAGSIAIGDVALSYRDNSRTPALGVGVDDFGAELALEGQFGAAEPQLRLLQTSAGMENIRLAADEAEPSLRVARLALEAGEFDLGRRAFTVSRVGLEGGDIDLVRDRNGRINLAQLFAPPEAGAARRRSESAAAAGTPWHFASKTIELSDFKVAFSDHTVKPDGAIAHLDPLNAKLTDVDGKSPTAFTITADIRQGGSLAVEGSADLANMTVASDIRLAGLALPSFQPYLDPVVSLILRSGTLSTQGRLRYAGPPEKGMMDYDGGFDVARLQFTEPGVKETFLGWQSLKTSQLKFRLQPDLLEIGELKLTQPVGKLIIEKDRAINLAKVFKAPAPAPPATSAPAGKSGKEAFPVRVKKLRVQNGTLEFADLSLITPFATTIHRLGGVVIGTSSARNARAQIDLEGQVDDYGSARIGGEINMFDPKGFTDIKMDFANVEMTRLTPYSGKFAGRKIDAGKLSLDLQYKIDNSRLLGENQIVVDRLKLGGRVESPGAVNLPLDLAVALLEDGNGVIDIGLPVKGNLEDPEFSMGHLVWKAFVNLVTKIGTSPFRALGALLGGETEDLDSVGFEPGKTDVPPPEAEKLQKLAQAMQKRPQLKLVVQGRFSPQQDGEALKSLAVRRTLAALAAGAEIDPDEDPGPLDYSDPETQRRLEAVFASRFGAGALKAFKAGLAAPAAKEAAPGTETAQDPGLVAKALFARLVADEALPETALPALATARAQAIVSRLTADGSIAAARVATKPPEPAPDEAPVVSKLTLDIVAHPS